MVATFIHDGVEVEILDGPYLSGGEKSPEATVFCSKLVNDIPAFKRYIAHNLLSLYNDVWFDEDIGTLTENSFEQRLGRPVIRLGSELGSAVIYFEDGDIFGGHIIELATQNEVPSHTKISG